jgi:hypothetical protein
LRSHPNRPFFSPAGAGLFLSSLEPNMEDGYLKVATRQSGASENSDMQNRLLLCPLVHLLTEHNPQLTAGASLLTIRFIRRRTHRPTKRCREQPRSYRDGQPRDSPARPLLNHCNGRRAHGPLS